MGLLQIILFLMLSAVALGWVARHFKFPYPIALVIGGGNLATGPGPPAQRQPPRAPRRPRPHEKENGRNEREHRWTPDTKAQPQRALILQEQIKQAIGAI